VRVILREVGYDVLTTASGEQALVCATGNRLKAAIVEAALPDISGLELCRRLRQIGQMPIIVLSTIDAESTKIEALEGGADDYMTKPFSPGELLARLAARLRETPSALRFEADGVVIDLAAHQVTRDGRLLHLTATELALLRVLVTTRGTVTHQKLASSIWGPSAGDAGARIRTHMRNLRVKLGQAEDRRIIETETGIGYRFSESVPGGSRSTGLRQGRFFPQDL